MIDLLHSLSRALPLLGEMSLTAAYAAAVVAALRLILKRRAPRQVLCLLWLVVFARLLIPVSLESPLSILPDQEQVQAVQDLPAMLIPAAPAQNPGQSPAQGQPGGAAANPALQETGAPDAPALSLPGGTPSGAPQNQSQAGFPWQALLAGVWLAGALAMGLYGIISYLRLRRRLFDAIRAGDGAWEHPSIRSPFILGVFRPRIYLPAGLSGMPRQFILCHERAHLRRLDHIVKPVCWAALAIHWFNPAVWAAFLLMSRDIEAACDEAVIRRLGPRVKADYSATLLALATGGRMPAPCPLAFDEGNAKGRIKNVLRYRRPALWIVVVSAVAAVLAAVCLLTDPVSAREPDEAPDPGASQSQAPEGGGVLAPWMAEVLDGTRTFRRADGSDLSQEYTMNQLNAFFYGAPVNTTVEAGKLAVIDLDKDGVNELVVWPEGDDEYLYSVVGYAILRRQGDEIYGYNPVYRSFGDLKSDGTFTFSSGADNWGIMTASFSEGGFELSHDNTITWCEGDGGEVGYFVNGLQATRAEFYAAIDAQDAKPEPVWYVYEDGVLKYAPINVPIPLDDYVAAGPVPDFLDGDQQELYRQALTMYGHIFGANTEAVDDWPDNTGFQYDYQDPSGPDNPSYVPATGRYSNWNDFEEAVLSVFTQRFWEERNSRADGTDTYINRDGILFYQPAARGSYGYNSSFPETFRLVSRTENAIEFIMTGYYSEPYPAKGESYEDRDARLEAGWEYSIEYPMRMVRTDRGWRFDEIHSAHTDNGAFPYYNQHIPNPDAPVPVISTPEPSAEPSAAPLACEHGLDDVSLEYVGGQLAARCNEDGFVYLIPGVTQSNYSGGVGAVDGAGWLLEDLDGDSHMELAIFTSTAGGSGLVVLDVENGAPVSSTLDARQMTDAFNSSVAYDYLDDLSTLEVSYLGQTAQSPVSEGWRSEMRNRGGGWDPEVWPTEARATWTGGSFLYFFPVFAARGYQTDLTAHWTVTYIPGGGLQISSFYL